MRILEKLAALRGERLSAEVAFSSNGAPGAAQHGFRLCVVATAPASLRHPRLFAWVTPRRAAGGGGLIRRVWAAVSFRKFF